MKFFSDVVPATTVQNSGGMTTGSTTLVLSSSLNSYFGYFPFLLRIDQGTPNEEIVQCVSGLGTVGSPYGIRRAQGIGQTAKAHVVGATVTHAFSAQDAYDGHPFGKTGTTTVANTTNETTLIGASTFTGALTLPGNYSAPGVVMRQVIWGTASTTGTPVLQLRTRLGGIGGVIMVDTGTGAGAQTGSGLASAPFRITAETSCQTDGSTSTWNTVLVVEGLVYSTTVPLKIFGPTTSGSIDVTTTKDVYLTVAWGTASSSNTISVTGGYSTLN